VQYYRCRSCNSLQTELPYWLDEAYSPSLSALDTGAAQRTIDNLVAAYVASRLLKLRNVLDFGGSDGLLCRLLRDYSVNCYVSDKFAKTLYAQGFTVANFSRPDLITAFEVFEHFANPAIDVEQLLASEPKAILLSTALYTNQADDWWYLAPETGQHVFFYSEKALSSIAAAHGYTMVAAGAYFLFVHPKAVSMSRAHIVARLLQGRIFRFLRAAMVFREAKGVWRDHEIMKSRLSS